MKRLVREPLVHFVILGGLLFAAYEWINRDNAPEGNVVRITQKEVDWLTEVWTRQRQRPPSQQELAGLVADYLKEQLLAHEAVELGLDDNDMIVRRRLAQKLEFMVGDTTGLVEPTESDLRRAYQENQDRYVTPVRFTFKQVFFKSEAAARRALSEDDVYSIAKRGDSSLLPPEYSDVDESTLARLLGAEFAARVTELEPGTWCGPLPSVYGYHLVSLSVATPRQPLPFEEVRAKVLEHWQHSREEAARKEFYAELLAKYDVLADEAVEPLLGPFFESIQ